MVSSFLLEAERHSPAAIVLPTGTTFEPRGGAAGVYELCARELRTTSGAYRRVPCANMDEYLVPDGECLRQIPLDHPDSYRRFMLEQFYRLLGIEHLPDNHIFPLPDGDGPHRAGTLCGAYSRFLAEHGISHVFGGIGTPVPHVAFNGDGSTLSSPARVVRLSEAEAQTNEALYGRESGTIPRFAATIGIAEIMAADKVTLAAFGEGKAEVVKRCLGKDGERYPAGLVLCWHPNVELFVDHAAAALVEDRKILEYL
jgi:glucosamine-6-phosphate deaminase